MSPGREQGTLSLIGTAGLHFLKSIQTQSPQRETTEVFPHPWSVISGGCQHLRTPEVGDSASPTLAAGIKGISDILQLGRRSPVPAEESHFPQRYSIPVQRGPSQPLSSNSCPYFSQIQVDFLLLPGFPGASVY